MESKVRYQRSFLMLEQEDTGFGTGQAPSGYIKVELKDGKGKIACNVQNLREDQGKIIYKLYALQQGEKAVLPVLIGVIPVNRGRGELQWEFETENVAMTGSVIADFKTFVILVEYKDGENKELHCPLVAYKDGKTSWREELGKVLYTTKIKQTEDEGEILTKQSVLSVYKGGLESVYTSHKGNNEVLEEKGKISVPVENEIKSVVENPSLDTYNYEEINELYTHADETILVEGDHGKSNDITHEAAELMDALSKNEENTVNGNTEVKINMPGCPAGNNGFCPQQTTNMGVSPCAACNVLHVQKEPENKKTAAGEPAKFIKVMDKYFEECDPFRSKRRDYRWWKVNTPVHLNNVLYQCNIHTPLLFNPKVITAHFKYRHLIAGIYTDRVRRREYIVCGVPGVYSIDDRPFGEMCRWVQVEGYRPKYGAFGYWLVYIDPRTGKFLSFK